MTQEHYGWVDELEQDCKDYDEEVKGNAKRYDRETGFELDDDDDE